MDSSIFWVVVEISAFFDDTDTTMSPPPQQRQKNNNNNINQEATNTCTTHSTTKVGTLSSSTPLPQPQAVMDTRQTARSRTPSQVQKEKTENTHNNSVTTTTSKTVQPPKFTPPKRVLLYSLFVRRYSDDMNRMFPMEIEPEGSDSRYVRCVWGGG